MFPAASLLTLLLALSITGSPVEIPRAAALTDRSRHHHAGRTPVTNDDVYYIAAVGVGGPPTIYNLIVDTGNSNTFVGASTKYVATRTSINTGQPVEVDYGSGFFSDAYTKYQSATGATSDTVTGLLTISSTQYTLIPPVHHFAQETYSLIPNAQIWPRSLNSNIADRGLTLSTATHSSSTSTLCSIFDTAKSRVGFATTSFTDATTN
ncbi:hypothetical protein BDR04DRAFT_1227692 [Suillus decipiens]|nr:hypothetical protein BDR04DRAFT_1227692 [Suillus decipiens]